MAAIDIKIVSCDPDGVIADAAPSLSTALNIVLSAIGRQPVALPAAIK